MELVGAIKVWSTYSSFTFHCRNSDDKVAKWLDDLLAHNDIPDGTYHIWRKDSGECALLSTRNDFDWTALYKSSAESVSTKPEMWRMIKPE